MEDGLTGHNEILEKLKADIEDDKTVMPEPLSGDKWILSSCLQKAIRRNEIVMARRAALSLWMQDRQSFWRRLHITAMEDIGIGDVSVVINVLTATASLAWRRDVGDQRVALFLVGLLCRAVKNRMADELFIQVERDRKYSDLRERLAKADHNFLADYVANQKSSLIERSLALWYLAGTRKFPSDAMPGRHGYPEKAVEILRGLDVSAQFVEACIGVMGRTSWPLSIFMPLIWQEIEKQPRPLYVFYEPVIPVPDVDGIPVYAADMFTRVGQGSIRELQKNVRDLKGLSMKQIGLALFYIEGCKVDTILTSESLDQFRQDGEFTDAESAGLDIPSYLGIKECVAANLPKFNEIRQKKIKQTLEGRDDE